MTAREGPAEAAGLVERSEVLAAVDRLLEVAHAGRGGALFIVGSAGLGKTSVLERAVALARPRFGVGFGGGDRVEAVLPFGLIGQVLDPLVGGDPRALATGEATEVSAQARLYAILRGIRQAAVRPLLLAFDDLHWSDPDSLTAIHLLCRRLGVLPVALIATLRPWPADALTAAQELAAQGCAEVEYLVPLSSGAAGALLRARAGKGVGAQVVEQTITVCGGNPLLLEQAAEQLHRHGRLSQAGVLLSRFLAIGPSAQRYLRAASVLGIRFRTPIAAAVAGIPLPGASTELDGLFRAGLLRDVGQGWAAFSHALVRQAVYDDLAPPTRISLHAAAFSVLLGHQVDPAEAAEHATAAHLAGDSRAVGTLARAGRQALATGAVRAARSHLEAAARLAGETTSDELLFDLGRALFADGAGEAAIATYERLLQRPALPDPERIAALRQLGQAALVTGAAERAVNCYESAVRLAEHTHPGLAIATLLDHAFHNQLLFGPGAGLPLVTCARELGRPRRRRPGASALTAAATPTAWPR